MLTLALIIAVALLSLLLAGQSIHVYFYRRTFKAAVVRINYLERVLMVEKRDAKEWPEIIK
jgi:hypothetical protein